MDAALRTAQKDRGAQFMDYHGRQTAGLFVDIDSEAAAVRRCVGLLDLSWRSGILFTGEDRASWLHGMTTNHVLALEPGQAQHTTCCDITGHLVGVLRLLNTGTALRADMHPACVEAVVHILNGHLITEDVEIEPDDNSAMFSLQGPRSAEVARIVLGVDMPGQFRAISADYHGAALWLLGESHTGEPGVDIVGPQGVMSALWIHLLDVVQGLQGLPVGLQALNHLRIEAGAPWWLEDLDPSLLMPEAGLDDSIHFEKGCYLGQETLARIHFRGHTNRQLSGLSIQGDQIPDPGALLLSDGANAGRLTSVVYAPTLRRMIGLGIVRREYLAPGTPLDIQGGGHALVCAIPFLAR